MEEEDDSQTNSDLIDVGMSDTFSNISNSKEGSVDLNKETKEKTQRRKYQSNEVEDFDNKEG